MRRVIVSVGAIAVLGFLISKIPHDASTRSAHTLPAAYQVARVSDGDTIAVSDGKNQKKIRLCGIDAPEKSQPLGTESKAYLEKLLRHVDSENLQIDEIERDRYGRSVSEVFVVAESEADADKFVNAEMVRSGMAYVFRRYLGSCPNASALEQAEEEAKRSHLGVWGGDYQKPWYYRHSKR